MHTLLGRLALLLLGATLVAAEEPVQTTPSGLKYQCLKAGQAGTEPKAGDKVKVHYVGTLTDGKKFDSSRDRGQPFEFDLGEGRVIAGWDEILTKMQIGSTYTVTIPWALAYGEEGHPPAIPAKADLVFEIELLSVTKGVPLPQFVAGDKAKQKTTATGLVYEEVAAGTGDAPKATDGVTLTWALWDTEGKLLGCDQRSGGPLGGVVSELRLGRWTLAFLPEAAALLHPGGTLRCEVPAKLAWGEQGMGRAVPPNATTIWQLTLASVNVVPAFAKVDEAKAKATASGIKYEVLKEGDGASPKATDEVTVNYTGWLTDGKSFDSSHARGETATFGLDQVIPGWSEAVQLMKVGGSARFLIPAKLAYGARPPQGSGIPANADLIFQIELVAIEK